MNLTGNTIFITVEVQANAVYAHLQLASIRPTDRHELLVPRCERLIAGTFRPVGPNASGAKEEEELTLVC